MPCASLHIVSHLLQTISRWGLRPVVQEPSGDFKVSLKDYFINAFLRQSTNATAENECKDCGVIFWNMFNFHTDCERLAPLWEAVVHSIVTDRHIGRALNRDVAFSPRIAHLH